MSIQNNPYNIKHDLTDVIPNQHKPCGKKCDLCDSFEAIKSYVIFIATRRKYCIRWDSTWSTPNVVYMASCKKCKTQGVGSIILWKPE